MTPEVPPRFANRSFIADIDAARERAQASWRDIARSIEVSPSTLTRLRQGSTPDLETFARLCKWGQLSPDNYLGVDDDSPPATSSLAGISALLRSDRSLNDSDVEVMEAMIRATYEKFRQSDQ